MIYYRKIVGMKGRRQNFLVVFGTAKREHYNAGRNLTHIRNTHTGVLFSEPMHVKCNGMQSMQIHPSRNRTTSIMGRTKMYINERAKEDMTQQRKGE